MIWANHPIYSSYKVSSSGLVLHTRPGAKPRKPQPDKDGYLRVLLSVDGKQKLVYIHTLVCEAFHGLRPFAGAQVRHRDGTKTNNTPSNLTWGTTTEQLADRYKHDSIPFGVRHPNARLDEAKVRLIRTTTNVSNAELAARYGVSRRLIYSIKKGLAWRHI